MIFKQKIEFVFSNEQLLRMLRNTQSTGIAVSLGVNDNREIHLIANGVKYVGDVVEATSDTENPCPIPPGCPTDPTCVADVKAHMPPHMTAEFVGISDAIQTFFLNQ